MSDKIVPDPSIVPKIPLQYISRLTTKDKYFKDGVDSSFESIHKRNARAIAEVEGDKADDYYPHFFSILASEEFLLAGRIKANAGAGISKTSTINCTVSGKINDDMWDIGIKQAEALLTLKAGCGIGYAFDSLRPAGAWVGGVGAPSSGPIPFMFGYDAYCNTVRSGGDRRGAQMGTFSIEHPDIRRFINIKDKPGILESLNLSVKLTDKFFRAVENDTAIDLTFNGKIYETVKARELFNLIMDRTYKYSDPGFLMVDRINQLNNNWFCEDIQATNPCGEQPLPPYGACLLSSINAVKFIDNPFTPNAKFNWQRFEYVVRVATRMMDNVVELANLPLKQQMSEIRRKRRHGLGYTGVGSACAMLGIRYGSEAAQNFVEELSYKMSYYSYDEGANIAKEKGSAPIFNEVWSVNEDNVYVNQSGQTWDLILTRDKAKEHGITAPVVNGLELWCASNFIKQFPKELQEKLARYGCRFTHATSIAPTGTISLCSNNVSNGIEPPFAWEYLRNYIASGKNTKIQLRVYDYAYLLYLHMNGVDVTKVEIETTEKLGADIKLPEYFATTEEVSAIDHIMMQAKAQKWIDSSISKTINVPTNTSYEDFQNLYMVMWKEGLKGGTTYRFNPEKSSGVLVKDEDIQNTWYEFTLADNTKVVVRGDENIEYDGQVHKASNLHDAIASGKYGWYA